MRACRSTRLAACSAVVLGLACQSCGDPKCSIWEAYGYDEREFAHLLRKLPSPYPWDEDSREPGLQLRLFVRTSSVDEGETVRFSAASAGGEAVSLTQEPIRVETDGRVLNHDPEGAIGSLTLDIPWYTEIRLEAEVGGARCSVEFAAQVNFGWPCPYELEFVQPIEGQRLGPEDDADDDPTDGEFHYDVVLATDIGAGIAVLYSNSGFVSYSNEESDPAHHLLFDSSPIVFEDALLHPEASPGGMVACVSSCAATVGDVVVEVE